MKLAVCLVVLLACSAYARFYAREKPSKAYPEQWFTQTLDHFNPQDGRTFQQRYYVNDQYYKPNGIIILYINGEGPVSGPPSDPSNGVVMIAQKFNAVIVTLEHRYYGKSVPFDTLPTANLQWLSSKYALYDLAVFAEAFRAKYPTNTPLITIGGSYSGALSAWFRLKFPQITRLSLSSSGVVNAILNFVEFDEQVSASAGDECAAALRATTAALEQAFQADPSGTRAKFNAQALTDDGDFWYMMADSGAECIQYGFHDQLCQPVVQAYQANTSLVDAYASVINNVWTPNLNPGGAVTYSTAFQAEETVAEERNERQWWYQTCTELAYFQNAPEKNSIRSHFVNMTYHRTHCEAVFGAPLWPDTNDTNFYYGGANIKATNVIYTQGSQDPWQQAGVMSTISPLQLEMTIKCQNCGHCVDLRGCPGGCADEAALSAARSEIVMVMAAWLDAP